MNEKQIAVLVLAMLMLVLLVLVSLPRPSPYWKEYPVDDSRWPITGPCCLFTAVMGGVLIYGLRDMEELSQLRRWFDRLATEAAIITAVVTFMVLFGEYKKHPEKLFFISVAALGAWISALCCGWIVRVFFEKPKKLAIDEGKELSPTSMSVIDRSSG